MHVISYIVHSKSVVPRTDNSKGFFSAKNKFICSKRCVIPFSYFFSFSEPTRTNNLTFAISQF